MNLDQNILILFFQFLIIFLCIQVFHLSQTLEHIENNLFNQYSVLHSCAPTASFSNFIPQFEHFVQKKKCIFAKNLPWIVTPFKV